MHYIIYSRENCHNCFVAKNVIKRKGIEYVEKEADVEYLRQLGVRELPYIIAVEGDVERVVGGLDSLMKEVYQ